MDNNNLNSKKHSMGINIFKTKKRLIVSSIISIILVSILFIGSTYSIFTSGEVDEDVNVYTTGTLDVIYTVSENNKIIMNNIPISNDNSSNIKPYRITVTNNGNVPYMFNLILEDTTASNAIDYKYIMTRVGELESISLDKTKNNVIREDIIVEAGKSVDIDVRVWLSDKVQNSEIGKSFYAKLAVEGKAIHDENREIDNSKLVSDWTGVAITLDGNGATKEGTKSVDVMQGEKLPTVTIPSRSYNITYNANEGEVSKSADTINYKFLGYYTAKDAGVQYYDENGVSVKENDFLENTTLYARWENTTTNLIVPTRSGYNFIGWYSDSELTKKVSVNDIDKDMTLYAKWELATYTISFDNNTGSGSMEDITCTYNEDCLLPKNTFTKTGYSFKGWLDSQDGEVKYQDEGKINYTNTSIRELTLYAKWGVNAYKLTVNPNGGTWNGSTSSQEFTQNYNTNKTIEVPSTTPYYTFTYNLNGGTSSAIANNTFSKPFAGWTKSGGGSITSNTPVATATQTYTYGDSDGTITADYSDATVRHPSNPSKSFTITYNNDGSIITQTVNDTFSGWYTEAGGGTQISDGSTATSNQNLYAHWTLATISLSSPTRTGYSFLGWYTSSSGGIQITASNIRSNLSNNTITLYAQWKKIELGAYVSLTPTQSSYTTDISKTGHTVTQTINPQELNLWRVIKLSSDNTMNIVSEHISSKEICFRGIIGYKNFVGYLNVLASQYENGTYTKGSRHFGYNGQTEYIMDTSKLSITTAPWDDDTGSYTVENQGGGDTLYTADVNTSRYYGFIKATSPKEDTERYWIASRYYSYYASNDYSFNGRFMNDGKVSNNGCLFQYGDDDWLDCYSIRPILILKSGLKYSGAGTEEDPIKLST